MQDALGTIATVAAERKSNLQKSPIKRAFPSRASFRAKNLLRGELLVEERDGLDSAEIIFQSDVFVGCVRVFVGQSEAQQHAGNFKCVVHLRDERNRTAFADENSFLAEAGFERVNRRLKNRMRVRRDPGFARAENLEICK